MTDSQGFQLDPHNLKYPAEVYRTVADEFREMLDGADRDLPWCGAGTASHAGPHRW